MFIGEAKMSNDTGCFSFLGREENKRGGVSCLWREEEASDDVGQVGRGQATVVRK
jgi:hypothetical protein